MKVSNTLKETLIRSAEQDVTDARNKLTEAGLVLEWARKLVVGQDLTTPTKAKPVYKRYFVASRTGHSKGHYIIEYNDGTIDCSCPGFQNRGRCWASDRGVYIYHPWVLAAERFDNNRNLALI